MKETNKICSPNYKLLKVYRKEILPIANLLTKSKNKNYAFYFIALLTQAVCENVDIKNLININGHKPNMYINEEKIYELFGICKRRKLFEILNVLKNEFGVIDYKLRKTFENGVMKYNVYFYISKCNSKIAKGNYSRNNDDAYTTALAIKNNEGFIFVDKKELFNIFFKNAHYPHGIGDLYVLLRINTVYKVRFHSVPDALCVNHIALWLSNDDKNINTSLYLRQSELAAFLNITTKSIQRYLKMLKTADILDYTYMQKRGTIIKISILDKIKNIINIVDDMQTNNIHIIKDTILNFIREYNKRKYISKEYTYSLNKRHLLFLNTLRI